MLYQTINPANGQLVKSFETLDDEQLETKLKKAAEAFKAWKVKSIKDRIAVYEKVAKNLESKADEYAQLMALEMGKPLAEGVAESKKCAIALRYYAENAESFLKPVPHPSDGSDSYVTYEPLGPILAIMPWNFPFWQLFRHAAPCFAAGNVILLKHSPNTPQCAQIIEDMWTEAGLPEGVLQNLYITNEQAANVIADSRIAGVTLTGSTRAGKQVAAQSGKFLKKTVLELGGSDPFIILPDADLDSAAQVGVGSRCLNSGQSCIAAKRFLVHESVAESFLQKFKEQMSTRVVGDPTQEGINIGPMAREDLRDELANQVKRSVEAGAKVVVGGKVPEKEGFFYEPTILTNVQPGNPAWSEEFFGPVAIFITFKDEEEMLKIANDSPYGLGASLWTEDKTKMCDLIPRIDAGAVFVNGLVKSDPRLPFGGIKESGYGRELAREGVVEFTNAKTVWIK